MSNILAVLSTVAILALAGCGGGQSGSSAGGLGGDVKVDGSSTVAPISMVAAELFHEQHPDVRITVGVSGTGGGFKKFLDAQPGLRTDINDASRAIKDAELAKARELGITFLELPVAKDGIAVVLNPKNTFCEYLSMAELKRIWEPGSKVTNWKEVRDGFPDLPLKLYGPGTDSGTFDYFTEAVNGKEKASRSDFTMSEDDNVLVQGVEGDAGAMGYFGFSYYEANKDKLKLVGVGPDAATAVKPSVDSIRTGHYQPLSRPLFLYVNQASLQRPSVAAFLSFYLRAPRAFVEHPKVNYVALDDEAYVVIRQRLQNQATGSVIAETHHTGPVDVARLYATTQPATGS